MFDVRRYTKADEERWNDYVANAKNATFLFDRSYMNYHEDRFNDYSLMFYKGEKLYAMLPAHRVDDTLFSHFGLTYGGLIMNQQVRTADILVLFEELNQHLRNHGFKRVVYLSLIHI